MKMYSLATILLGALYASGGHAAIVCTAEEMGHGKEKLTLTLDLENRQATVEVGKNSKQIPLDHMMWDGHMKGLITGEGLAFLYSSWFGCIREAQLTTDVRLSGPAHSIEKVSFNFCSGGSTSDEACSR